MSDTENQTSEQILETAEVIDPKTVIVVVGDGQEVEIYKCKVRHIGMTLNFVLGVFKDLGITTNAGAAQAIGADLKNPQVVLQLIATKAPEVFGLVSEMCSLSFDDLQDLDMDDGIAVTLKVWEVNQLFFLVKVLPLVKRSGLFGNLASPATQEKDSPTPSAISSKPGSRRRKS